MTIIKISDKIRLASKQNLDHRTIVEVGSYKIGGDKLIVIAGATSQGKYRALSRLFPSTKDLRITDLDYRTVYRFRVRPPSSRLKSEET